jgi:putative oxidoreductase
MVLIGAWTRLFAFIAAGEMAVAYFMVHAPKSFFPALNMGEAAILFCFAFLYLAAAGAGAWSVDAARAQNAPIR